MFCSILHLLISHKWGLAAYLPGILLLASFIGCSKKSDSNEDDYPGQDSISISLISPEDSDSVFSPIEIAYIVEANTPFVSFEFYVDRQPIESSISTQIDAIYYDSLSLIDFDAGQHELIVRIEDSNAITAESDPVDFYFLHDFAPESNGFIRAEIIHYLEESTIDPDGPGDPYFLFYLTVDAETLLAQSKVFNDTTELFYPFLHDFDVPDSLTDFFLTIFVYDFNEGGDDKPIDYTTFPLCQYYMVSLNTGNLPHFASYRGSEDGNPDEADCKLDFRVTIQ